MIIKAFAYTYERTIDKSMFSLLIILPEPEPPDRLPRILRYLEIAPRLQCAE